MTVFWPVVQSQFPKRDYNINPWQAAIDDELVTSFLGIATDECTYEYAKKKLSELIQWHIDVATDPAVNGGYKLRKVRNDSKTNEISLGDVIRDRST